MVKRSINYECAFSSSLLGLAGSLILGLLDLNLGQAQNKFSQYFEKHFHQSSIVSSKEDKPTTLAIQKIYNNLDNVVSFKKTSDNHSKLSKLDSLIEF